MRAANLHSLQVCEPAILPLLDRPTNNETRNGQKAIAGFVPLPGRISNFFD
jgi:hypothetical protein